MYTRDLIERVLRTFLQALLATLAAGVAGVVDLTTAKALLVAGASAGIAAVMGLVARSVGSPDNASFVEHEG